MYRTLFPGDFFANLDRLQREFLQSQRYGSATGSIRGFGRGAFPALNVGSTPEAIEIFAFAPGLDPASVDVTIDRGVLTLSGERPGNLPGDNEKTSVHINERYAGSFQRVVSLSDDVDPDSTSATYRDGVLHISIKRRSAAPSRRINIQ